MRLSATLAAALALLLSTSCASPPRAALDARAFMEQGNLRAADQRIAEGLAEHPRDPSLWRLKIRLAGMRGDAAGAVASYREWVALRGGPDADARHAMALATLWHALEADAPAVRAEAIRAAWALDAGDLGEPVAERLGDDDEVVRATAAAALLRSHPDASTVLRRSLRAGDPDARLVAVTALADRVGEAALDDVHAMVRDEAPRVRAATCTAIAKLGAPESTHATLLRLATKDPEGLVRAAALRALARLEPALTRDVAVAALGDSYLGARLAAVALLARSGDAAAKTLAELATGSDPFVALRAAAALATRGPRATVDAALATGLGHAEWTVRAAAVGAAESALGEAAKPLVVKALADPRVEVRLAAARALIALGDRDAATAALVAALADPAADVRVEAAIDLRRLGDARAEGALIALLGDEDAAVRTRAATALRSRGPLPDDALVGRLADGAWPVRVAAAWTLLAAGDDD